jgi:hypothetical protein
LTIKIILRNPLDGSEKMKVEKDKSGIWIATGELNGIPYIAEGATRAEAFAAALLLIKERWGHTIH